MSGYVDLKIIKQQYAPLQNRTYLKHLFAFLSIDVFFVGFLPSKK